VPPSLATVAQHAGVTKGAVQHHFGTREDLFAAMYADTLMRFESLLDEALEGDSGPGSEARAYMRATFRCGSDVDMNAWRSLIVATVVERALAARWSDWVSQARSKDQSIADLIMRLASDGLWLSDVLGTYDISADERAELENALLELQRRGPRK
jgi:AcrR family transcriptional regulator